MGDVNLQLALAAEDAAAAAGELPAAPVADISEAEESREDDERSAEGGGSAELVAAGADSDG